jgi:hypothetical protein
MSRNRHRQTTPAVMPMRDVKLASENLQKMLDDFAAGQHEIMHTAQFIADQRAALDSSAATIEAAIRRTFPDLGEKHVNEALALIVPVMREVRKTSASLELDQDERNRIVSKAVRELAEQLEAVLPPGHAYPCTAAALSAFRSRGRSSRLRASLLISLIAEFEVLISNLFGEVFRADPSRAVSNDKTFGWEFILGHEDLSTLRDNILDEAVMAMMYQSYGGWLDKLEQFKVKIPAIARDAATQEVFQRRHVIVHNGGRVSAAYLRKLKRDPKPELNQLLAVGPKYLGEAADSLFAVGVALLASVAERIIPKAEDRLDLDARIAKRIYELLTYRRFAALVKTCNSMDVGSLAGEESPMLCKVNYWLALKRLERFEECREDVLAWDTSEVAPRFKLARFALLDEIEEGLALIDEIRGTQHMAIEAWASWPLLEELRRAESDRVANPEQEIVV